MRRYTVALLVILLTFCTMISVVNANPYVGGYFKSSKFTTGRVIMGANFPIMYLDIIPSGHYIGPVLSVAGGKPAVSGYIYQSFLAVHRDGYVRWTPQIWYGNNSKWLPTAQTVGKPTYIAYYVEIFGIGDGKADFKAFVYDTQTRYENNQPIIYQKTAGINTGDTTFFVGNEDVSGKRMNYLQFGVEASTNIGQVGKWDIQNYDNAYYDSATSKWKYLPGYSIQGSKAYISYTVSPWKVGGDDYPNVNKYLTSVDSVRWRYTGTTIGNDVVLWSSSGVVTPYPYK